MSFTHDVKIIVTQPRRLCRLLVNSLCMWRTVAQFVDERQRGDYFSTHAASLNDVEYKLLEELVRDAERFSGPIIEIGTLLGATTTRIAAWTSPDKRILTLDNYSWTRWGLTSDTQFDLAGLVLFHPISRGQVQQCRADKNQWCADYDGQPPSLVFCDAIHTYEETTADIVWARRVGAKVIAGHDYSDDFPGVVQAVNEAGGPAKLAGSLWSLAAASDGGGVQANVVS